MTWEEKSLPPAQGNRCFEHFRDVANGKRHPCSPDQGVPEFGTTDAHVGHFLGNGVLRDEANAMKVTDIHIFP